MVKTLSFHCRGLGSDRSLVGKLGSHVLHDVAKKKKLEANKLNVGNENPLSSSVSQSQLYTFAQHVSYFLLLTIKFLRFIPVVLDLHTAKWAWKSAFLTDFQMMLVLLNHILSSKAYHMSLRKKGTFQCFVGLRTQHYSRFFFGGVMWISPWIVMWMSCSCQVNHLNWECSFTWEDLCQHPSKRTSVLSQRGLQRENTLGQYSH